MREMEILKGLEGGENMAVQFVDHLLALGLRKKASDIHLEPGEEQMTVRMRTDGRLKVCAAVEMRHHPMILTRVKVMADMDIAEKRLPQDGHIRASIQGKATDLRVSVIPTIHGEKAVLRFLNTDTVIDSPETFGMSEENYGKVLDILKRPNGIFYITGPTGSGKTTTLYMILERLAELPVNIVAIEDPVEKHIRGISQMQVNTQAGLTFETGAPGCPAPGSGRDHGRRDQGQPDAEDQCPGCGNGPSGAFHASYEQRGGDCGADAGHGCGAVSGGQQPERHPGPEAREEDLSGL